jgi:two-component system osmolarity sensor histidine kinase EnvZ|tara:strand:- start:2060 stop:3355 length:1296 start_codon:yes stop_codon:yes gene_type:complete
MPKRLYWRAAFILLFPVIFLQLIVSVVIIKRHFEGVTEQMTGTVASQIKLIATKVEAAEIDAAIELSEALNMKLLAVESDKSIGSNSKRFYDVSGIVVIRELYKLKWVQNVDLLDDDYVTVTLRLADMIFQLQFDRARVSASNPHQLIVNMVVFGAFFTLIAFMYLRNQLRPITRLAVAAEAFGRGQTVPYTASGAIEVKAAGNAFLEMRNRIERHIEQRTMILSGVSHDLRTPLTRLKLGISLLDSDDKEPLERDLEEMRLMLDEFLTFAKAQDNEQSNFELLKVSSILDSLKDDYQRSNAKLQVANNITTGSYFMRPSLIRRALDNIIGNALRYGTLANLKVTIDNEYINFIVEDDGPGIPAEMRPEALKPFSRLDPARNQDKGMGVGLGLPIASDIAQAHGGSLRLLKSDKYGGLRAEFKIAAKKQLT